MERAGLAKYDLPDVPGVYLFTRGKGRAKKVLYVGKATSLRDRVRSYFDDDLIATRGPRVVDMVTLADGLSHEMTPTVLEALVREAALIREYKPKANVEGKDDKTFLYACITDETIPRVLAIRGKDIDFKKKTAFSLETPEKTSLKAGSSKLKAESRGVKLRAIHGPFPSGYQLREALRLIRRIFPFYDTERPVGEGSRFTRGKIEFNRQLGLYPKNQFQPIGHGLVEKSQGEFRKQYARSIRNVSLFLSGRVKALRATLARDMKQAAREERFEDAAIARRQLFALDHVQDVSLIREDRDKDTEEPRIEAFDTAHISGTNAIGVTVVIEEGRPNKKEYRTFRIKGVQKNDDIASLKEIITRRFGHPEWLYPKAVVIDGGRTHKKAAETTLAELGFSIPVIAVVKDEKHRPREIIGSRRAGVSDASVVLANAEAHRFAITLHRRARRRSLRAAG